jgi:iron complex outermembrane receptor protein
MMSKVPLALPGGLLLGVVFSAGLTAVTFGPAAAAADQPTGAALEELRFLKEETVSIAVRHEQPISEAPSNVYVITDEDIRQSGATDIPTVLRRIPGLEVMQTTGADFNGSTRVGSRVMGWLTIRW